eukprot:gnl/Trimastix_PCT/1665.p1 GENE.gnl/Trimastix_PCT/1665~~gnl/Trimastix_PCT/1665.p1  ORF type:complete len:571 (+),score=188.29 gnl/Trimastix_PCT/1665:42-1754(+)
METEPQPQEQPKEGPVRTVTEGKASILLDGGIFYNNVQCFNRDLSTLMLTLFSQTREIEWNEKKAKMAGRRRRKKADPADPSPEELEGEFPGIRILESLAASGLRSVRYTLEVPKVRHVVANDLDPAAVEMIRRNIEHNGIAPERITANQGDATLYTYGSKAAGTYFDAIDLDPYGTPAPFLDATVQAVANGGLLAITCTDMGVLCGNNPEVCFAKYGSIPVKGKFCHEMALRICLANIATLCARHGRYLVPVLSLSADFYIRVFVRVWTSQVLAKRTYSQLSHLFKCNQCPAFQTQPLGRIVGEYNNPRKCTTVPAYPAPQCAHCGGRIVLAGPLWNSPLHDVEVLRRALEHLRAHPGQFQTEQRIRGVLTTMSEELNDVMLYYNLHDICQQIHVMPPPIDALRSAIVQRGHRVAPSHISPLAIKTDAPAEVVWDVMRHWARLRPPKTPKPDTAAARILAVVPSDVVIDWALPPPKPEPVLPEPEVAPGQKVKKLTRFPPNPEKDWGPKARAHRSQYVQQAAAAAASPEPTASAASAELIEGAPAKRPPSPDPSAEAAKKSRADTAPSP